MIETRTLVLLLTRLFVTRRPQHHMQLTRVHDDVVDRDGAGQQNALLHARELLKGLVLRDHSRRSLPPSSRCTPGTSAPDKSTRPLARRASTGASLMTGACDRR